MYEILFDLGPVLGKLAYGRYLHFKSLTVLREIKINIRNALESERTARVGDKKKKSHAHFSRNDFMSCGLDDTDLICLNTSEEQIYLAIDDVNCITFNG